MVKPGRLKRGDAIAIVAPAGKIDSDVLNKGAARIEKLGFEVRLGKSVARSHRYFAGTDAERREDFEASFMSGVRAVLCARGGYGSARLIPSLDLISLKKKKVILIGSSDITTLLLQFHQAGMPAFHGPMASHFARAEDALSDRFFLSMLTSPEPMGKFSFPGVEAIRKGSGEGALTGGCLSLICASIGTSYEIKTAGKILFIEDINEPPYRIDRMLTHLKLAGKLKGIKGIIFGQMIGCDPPSGSDYTLPEAIASALEGVNAPILYGLPFGHGEQNITLPYGLKVRIDSRDRSMTFLESPVK